MAEAIDLLYRYDPDLLRSFLLLKEEAARRQVIDAQHARATEM